LYIAGISRENGGGATSALRGIERNEGTCDAMLDKDFLTTVGAETGVGTRRDGFFLPETAEFRTVIFPFRFVVIRIPLQTRPGAV